MYVILRLLGLWFGNSEPLDTLFIIISYSSQIILYNVIKKNSFLKLSEIFLDKVKVRTGEDASYNAIGGLQTCSQDNLCSLMLEIGKYCYQCLNRFYSTRDK